MENIKENLDNRLCDCLEGSTNTKTYREFFIWGWKELNLPMSDCELEALNNMTNDELNEMLDELEWLLSK